MDMYGGYPKLPTELYENIGEHLSDRDLAAASRTSRTHAAEHGRQLGKRFAEWRSQAIQNMPARGKGDWAKTDYWSEDRHSQLMFGAFGTDDVFTPVNANIRTKVPGLFHTHGDDPMFLADILMSLLINTDLQTTQEKLKWVRTFFSSMRPAGQRRDAVKKAVLERVLNHVYYVRAIMFDNQLPGSSTLRHFQDYTEFPSGNRDQWMKRLDLMEKMPEVIESV
jgi:hypothetical protein